MLVPPRMSDRPLGRRPEVTLMTARNTTSLDAWLGGNDVPLGSRDGCHALIQIDL